MNPKSLQKSKKTKKEKITALKKEIMNTFWDMDDKERCEVIG